VRIIRGEENTQCGAWHSASDGYCYYSISSKRIFKRCGIKLRVASKKSQRNGILLTATEGA
jgi:hypothetical protein